MKKINIFVVNAFTHKGLGGNPAGIVLDCNELNDNDMQKIANKLGLSETCFVVLSNHNKINLRYFTPVDEVDLCGHATIATLYTLKKIKNISINGKNIETKAGTFKIYEKEDGFFMEQKRPEFFKTFSSDEIARCLNITEKEILHDIPIQIISTGLRDLLIPVNNLEILNKININEELVKKFCLENNLVSFHVFTLEKIFNSSTAHCRNFAPLFGIKEESATGTSNCALACYLQKYDKVKNLNMIFEQGYSMNFPSKICVSLELLDASISFVKVGGKAKIMNKIIIQI
jgi:PhzF family phenazine biosynthesis protein